MSNVILIERDPDTARQVKALLEDDGHTVTVVADQQTIYRLLPAVHDPRSADVILLNVQTVVNNDIDYKWDSFDLERLAEELAATFKVYTPSARVGVFATIPNRAHSLIESLKARSVEAGYVEMLKSDAFGQFIRDSPVTTPN